jgi:cytochrome P450
MTLAATEPLIPPAPTPTPQPNSWAVVQAIRRGDSLAMWGPFAYEKMIIAGRFFGRFNALVNEPAAIRRVLGAGSDAYVKPVLTRRVVRPIVGQGLLLAEGAEWKGQRRALAPSFTPAHVQMLTPHFAAAAQSLIADVGGRQGRVRLVDRLQETALDAVGRALFSVAIGGRGARIASLARGYGVGAGRPGVLDLIVAHEPDLAWLSPARIRFRKAWLREVDAIVAGRRRGERAGGGEDMLDLLIKARDPETGEAFSDAEIRDQASTMLAAGFETTGRTLFWTLYLLALANDEQAAIREELAADPPQDSLEDVARRWPRLRRAILETLRLYPAAPLLARLAVKADRLLDVDIPAGGTITVSPWVVHRHKALWDNPSAFIPDRFLGNPQEHLAGGRYIPFGAGPRICIGASFALTEAALVLAMLLSRFEVAMDDERPLTPKAVITTQPSIDPWFRLTPVGPQG